jgi:hypothetical protein
MGPKTSRPASRLDSKARAPGACEHATGFGERFAVAACLRCCAASHDNFMVFLCSLIVIDSKCGSRMPDFCRTFTRGTLFHLIASQEVA